MNPGFYTELFFLDESTALAAGHRPCAECRYKEFKQFKNLWSKINLEPGAETKISAKMLDQQLHKERLKSDLSQKTFRDHFANLPDGTFIKAGNADQPYLWFNRKLYLWTPSGYELGPEYDQSSEVTVVTPPGIVNVLKHGYRPIIHPSIRL